MNEDVFVFPRSFAQQRLAFLDQLAPENPFYNAPSVARVAGPLNVVALKQAFHEIVRRHESFSLGEWDCEANTFRLTSAELQRPFNLERGPLLRVRLLRLGKPRYQLIRVSYPRRSTRFAIRCAPISFTPETFPICGQLLRAILNDVEAKMFPQSRSLSAWERAHYFATCLHS